MTVANDTARAGPYIGDDVATEFAFSFRILEDEHIQVIQSADGVDATLSLGSDYTVTGVGSASGSVILAAPLPTGETLTIIRSVPLTQTVDLQNQGGFFPDTVERMADLLTMAVQQQAERLNRAVLVSASDEPSNLVIPNTAGRANKALVFDADGDLAVSADDYEDQAAAAAASASAASASATAASGSATAAAASATAAGNSATAAAASATAADASADAAAVSAADAAAAGADNAADIAELQVWVDYRFKEDLHDYLAPLLPTAENYGSRLQAAINDRAPGGAMEGVPLYLPASLIRITDTIMFPAGIVVIGRGRHPSFKRYGDTTGGTAHPYSGTVISTWGAGTARRWTDVSDAAGTAVDADIKPAFVLLGEGGALRDLTLITGEDLANAWDTGIHRCGVSNWDIQCVEVRGISSTLSWKIAADYWDATWSNTNTTLTALAAARAAWYVPAVADYGLTQNKTRFCIFRGVNAVKVQGTKRTTGTWVWAPNGISDSAFDQCLFYNEGDVTQRRTDAALVAVDYRVAATTPAQGLSFNGCRFDAAAIWALDLDWISDVSFNARCFCETSEAWYNLQVAAAVPTEQQRGRISRTANTGMLHFEGEWFANLALDKNTDNGRLRTHRYRAQGGDRITYQMGDGATNFPGFWCAGENETTTPTEIQSFSTNGRVSFVSLAGGSLSTYAHIMDNEFNLAMATAVFKRSGTTFLSQSSTSLLLPIVPSDTTAAAANMNMNGANGNVRLSTSSMRYKKDAEPIELEIARRVLREVKPIWYRSTANGDRADWSWYGISAEELAEVDPRLVHWKEGEMVKKHAVDADGVRQYEIDPDTGKPRPIFDLEFRRFKKAIPDGVQYERVALMTQVVVADHDRVIEEHSAQIAELQKTVAELVAKFGAAGHA